MMITPSSGMRTKTQLDGSISILPVSAVGPSDEERDNSGKWTKGGDSGTVISVPEFKTDSEARQWAKKNLDVDVAYQNGNPPNAELGLTVTSGILSGLVKGKELGMVLPSKVVISPLDEDGVTPLSANMLARTLIDKHSFVLSPYERDSFGILVNPTSPMWADLNYWSTLNHKEGITSTSSVDHAIVHELAHIQHALQHKASLIGNKLLSYVGRKLGKTAGLGSGLLPPEKSLIEKNVSLYAGTAPNEFVAEAYTAMKLDNKIYPPEIMALYKKYGGPK